MYKIDTKDGERYLVILTLGASYTLGTRRIPKHGVLPVTKRTRDYLVNTTKHFQDYDPAPVDTSLPNYSGAIEDVQRPYDPSEFRDLRPLTSDDLSFLAAKSAQEAENDQVNTDDVTGAKKSTVTVSSKKSSAAPKSAPKTSAADGNSDDVVVVS